MAGTERLLSAPAGKPYAAACEDQSWYSWK